MNKEYRTQKDTASFTSTFSMTMYSACPITILSYLPEWLNEFARREITRPYPIPVLIKNETRFTPHDTTEQQSCFLHFITYACGILFNDEHDSIFYFPSVETKSSFFLINEWMFLQILRVSLSIFVWNWFSRKISYAWKTDGHFLSSVQNYLAFFQIVRREEDQIMFLRNLYKESGMQMKPRGDSKVGI